MKFTSKQILDRCVISFDFVKDEIQFLNYKDKSTGRDDDFMVIFVLYLKTGKYDVTNNWNWSHQGLYVSNLATVAKKYFFKKYKLTGFKQRTYI